MVSLFLTFGFIPNTEPSAKVTRELKYVGDTHNVYRVASVKIKFLNDGNYLPAFSVGLHNPASELVGVNHFNATYFAAIKNLVLSKIFSIGLTVGEGFDWIEAVYHQFVGTFGGLLCKLGGKK